MKKYERPVVMINEELAEGVYAASGDCYTFTANIVQTPAVGNEVYTIQIDGKHAATDNHCSTSRIVKIVFNKPVTYVDSKAAGVAGSGTAVLSLTYTDGINGSYHNNGVDNIGLGNLIVKADADLAITSVSCVYCDNACVTQNHSW